MKIFYFLYMNTQLCIYLESIKNKNKILAIYHSLKLLNPIELRTAKTLWSFDPPECSRVKFDTTDIKILQYMLIVYLYLFSYIQIRNV